MGSMFIRKALPTMLIMLTFSVIIASVRSTSPVPIITQTSSTATVYLNPPTIDGTVIGQEFTVDLLISDAVDISGWMAGLLFNASVLECTGYVEGTFLADVGPTDWNNATINNTLGVIEAHGCWFLGDYKASGSGQLAYITFEVKAIGISDLHLRDVLLVDYYFNAAPADIIDVYTVVQVTPHQTVVIESNSSGQSQIYRSGFYDHSFNNITKEISFKVTGPNPGFSSISIPKALLSVENLDDWTVIIDGSPLSTAQRVVTENDTHYSIIFTYSGGVHSIDLTTRAFLTSTISIDLSSDEIALGSYVTISGNITVADDPEDTKRANATVTIERETDGTWILVGTNKTNSNSIYSYRWKPDAAGTYKIRAKWDGDTSTEGAVSEDKTLTVKGKAGIDPYILAAIAVAIIVVIIVIVVYFVKIRKPEEEE